MIISNVAYGDTIQGKFYGVNKQIFQRIGKWFNKEIIYKWGFEVKKIEIDFSKKIRCRKCGKKIDIKLAAITNGYCENCSSKEDKKKIDRIVKIMNSGGKVNYSLLGAEMVIGQYFFSSKGIVR